MLARPHKKYPIFTGIMGPYLGLDHILYYLSQLNKVNNEKKNQGSLATRKARRIWLGNSKKFYNSIYVIVL